MSHPCFPSAVCALTKTHSCVQAVTTCDVTGIGKGEGGRGVVEEGHAVGRKSWEFLSRRKGGLWGS